MPPSYDNPPTYTQAPMEVDSTKSLYQQSIDNLAYVNEFKVKQSFSFWEAVSQGCCEQLNTYKVYNLQNDEELMMLREDSDCCNRMCCAPQHTYKVGILGVGEGAGVLPEDGFAAMNDRPVLLEREGCCSKLLCCFSMMDCCANHAEVMVPAEVPAEAEERKGQYRFEEKLCNGCTPEIVVFEGSTPIAVIAGPSLFGGCSELCCDYDYSVTTCDANGNVHDVKGDICMIEKKKPEGCCAILQEMLTDSDTFEMHFNANSKYASDGQFKAVMLGALVYLDFMFFEMDNGMCEPTDDGGCRFTLFNCYVCGCICPCACTVGGSSGEGSE